MKKTRGRGKRNGKNRIDLDFDSISPTSDSVVTDQLQERVDQLTKVFNFHLPNHFFLFLP